MKTYMVNEVFYSLQGEGLRAGTVNVFVRFTGCNLTCSFQEHGFDCDTEFSSGRKMTAKEILADALKALPAGMQEAFGVGVIFTGGEPLLQLDRPLVDLFKEYDFGPVCVETNGTKPARGLDIDWISCSPKSAEHTLLLEECHELRYVRRHGMGVPQPRLAAGHLFISPACSPSGFDAGDIAWCIELVCNNPTWRLSMQQHKLWRVR